MPLDTMTVRKLAFQVEPGDVIEMTDRHGASMWLPVSERVENTFGGSLYFVGPTTGAPRCYRTARVTANVEVRP